jgi:tetratricopeptide (TPR) repeat protein
MGSKGFNWVVYATIGLVSMGLPRCKPLTVRTVYEDEGSTAKSAEVLMVPDSTRKEAVMHFREAQKLLKAGDLEKAEGEIKLALSLDPEQAVPHLLAGDIYAAKGQPGKAVQFYARARDLDESKALPHAKLGEAYLASGMHDKAVAAFETAVTLEPQVPMFHQRLGAVYKELGREPEGQDQFRIAQSLSQGQRPVERSDSSRAAESGEPPLVRIMKLGDEFLKEGLPDLAVEMYGIAAARDPENAIIRQKLGDGHLKKGAVREAVKHYEWVIALRPDLPLGYLGLGAAYSRMFQVDRAIDFLNKGLSLAPDLPMLRFELALAHIKADRLDQAILELEKAVQFEQNSSLPKEILEKVRQEKAAEEGFTTLEGKYFILKHDSNQDADFIANSLEWLEKEYERLGSAFSYRPEEKIAVKLYPDLKVFHEAASTPDWFYGGVASARDNKILLATPKREENIRKFPQVLTHELTHVFVNRLTYGNRPVWFHEGLALYMAGQWDPGKAEVLKWAIQEGRIFRLRELEGPFTNFREGREIGLAYAQSYALVRYVIERYGMAGVSALIASFGEGNSFSDAAPVVLGLRTEDFEREWLRFMKGQQA